MAQPTTTAPALDGFLSIVQSLASELAPSTTPSSTLSTSTFAPISTTLAATSASLSSSSSLTSTATPTNTASASSSNAGSGLSTSARNAIIIVCTIVGVLLLALIALLICCCVRRRRRRRGDPIGKEPTKEIGTPLRGDDWYHGNESHHGYVGGQPASASQAEMAQRQSLVDGGLAGGLAGASQSQDKLPRHSVSEVRASDEEVPPNLADHPAFATEALSRDSDPYKAAGVGAAGPSVMAAAASRKSREESRKSQEDPSRKSIGERGSLGERRLSDHMPARKPVGSPPSLPSRSRNSSNPNPLKIDTQDGALGAAALGAGAGALAGGVASHNHHRHSSPMPRNSASTDPFSSPKSQYPEPTATSPLSSHPSNPLLVGGTSRKRDSYYSQRSIDENVRHARNKRDSYQSQKSFDDEIRPVSTQIDTKGKKTRPLTPMDFDFGLDNPTTHDTETAQHHAAESEPLSSGFEPPQYSVSKVDSDHEG